MNFRSYFREVLSEGALETSSWKEHHLFLRGNFSFLITSLKSSCTLSALLFRKENFVTDRMLVGGEPTIRRSRGTELLLSRDQVLIKWNKCSKLLLSLPFVN